MKYLVLLLIGLYVPSAISDEISNVDIENVIQSLQIAIDAKVDRKVPDDAYLTISQYVTKYGYSFESHEITTEDGYILELQRIPAKIQGAPAALFVHGLACSAIDWVNQGPNASLALLMSDLGYDIWLFNSRGSINGMKHETFNSSTAEFWSFSFHEKGYYDLKATVDHIIETTSLEKITLIGHSEGTSSAMVLASTRSEYNDKFNLVVFLSPISYMGGVTSPLILFLTSILDELVILVNAVGFHGFAYSEQFAHLLVSACSIDGITQICGNLLGALAGPDIEQLDLDQLLIFFSSKPSGVSARQLIHYGQEILADTFREYDYGAIENYVKYGSTSPPVYNVSQITAPVAAYYSSNDYFAGVTSVERLVSELPNVVDQYLIEYEQFNHLDFILAKDVKTMIYDRVISLVSKFNPL
ncbi:lipase 3 [Dendroctonus ponderosae]|uniref:Lipase n=1 Tax=Dendroctonus ponderosae TaxID=77166 RepID=J3JU27_DENPD|nr:lipase 3 [Dendroctonus ponderosae]XP_048522625.1 lipase 3 [Dendroctonus ponderosae]AEE61701.1 unknown [Dendroctonus ponderosae]ERL86266.1 hypothetical protein D910_03675 [Dendroctonus ponderosae]